MTNWTSVCRLDELEAFWGEAVLVDGAQFALFRLADDRLFVVSNEDPATGAQVMSRGIVGSRGDRATIASPLHKQVYDLESGECYSAPEFELAVFAVRVRDGRVELDTSIRSRSADIAA
jgi:nitrite reductase (NADH) small subunit